MSPWEKPTKAHECNLPNPIKAEAAGRTGQVWRCGTCKKRWELARGTWWQIRYRVISKDHRRVKP